MILISRQYSDEFPISKLSCSTTMRRVQKTQSDVSIVEEKGLDNKIFPKKSTGSKNSSERVWHFEVCGILRRTSIQLNCKERVVRHAHRIVYCCTLTAGTRRVVTPYLLPRFSAVNITVTHKSQKISDLRERKKKKSYVSKV